MKQSKPQRLKLQRERNLTRVLLVACLFYAAKPHLRRSKPSRAVNKLANLSIRSKAKVITDITQLQTVDKLYQMTTYWHGSGRYQYGTDGKIIDVLQSIIHNGGLRPKFDTYDPAGPIESISVTPHRLYARAYSDMHGQGKWELHRHGSSQYWATYFFSGLALPGFFEIKPWSKSSKSYMRHFNNQNWAAKVHTKLHGIVTPFIWGSDITGNYPILIGLKADSVRNDAKSRTINRYERRIAKTVPLSQFTYIEVPANHVLELQNLLQDNAVNIPVIAIEDAESLAATIAFSTHVT